MNKTKLFLSAASLLSGHMNPAVAIGPGNLGNLSGQTVSIGNTFSASSQNSYFNDVYIFDISPQSAAIGTTVTVNFDLPFFPGPEFQLSNKNIKFTNSTDTITYASDSQVNPLDDILSVSAFLPAALDYRFVVSGNVTGNLGGSYAGILQALPIPEPDTHALLLAGLGMIGRHFTSLHVDLKRRRDIAKKTWQCR